MLFSKLSTVLLAAVCTSAAVLKRANSEFGLYVYGDNIDGLPIFYGDGGLGFLSFL
jgi:hypothetical protein